MGGVNPAIYIRAVGSECMTALQALQRSCSLTYSVVSAAELRDGMSDDPSSTLVFQNVSLEVAVSTNQLVSAY